MKQFVDANGWPTNLVTTDENIEKQLQLGNIEVPMCIDFFYSKKWDFQNEVWIEGATPEEISEQAGTEPIRTVSEVLKLTIGANPKPNDGDVWLESNSNTGLKIRINGVTKTITLI